MAQATRTRVSLTKTDLGTSAGLALLEVLQSIADDGQLTPEEVEQLRAWLTAHADSALPGRAHLDHIVTEILKDGVITDGEYALLHDAILRVLPRSLRSIATLRRRERKTAQRQAQRQQVADARAKAEAEKARNRPLERGDFMVAGTTKTAERRSACEYVSPGDQVWLEREPDNPYDPNAILIEDDTGDELGYVPREYAADFAPLLDAGAHQDFTIKKCLETASGLAIPVVRGALYAADSRQGRRSRDEGTSHLTDPYDERPVRRRRASASSLSPRSWAGCLLWASMFA